MQKSPVSLEFFLLLYSFKNIHIIALLLYTSLNGYIVLPRGGLLGSFHIFHFRLCPRSTQAAMCQTFKPQALQAKVDGTSGYFLENHRQAVQEPLETFGKALENSLIPRARACRSSET